MELAKLGKKGQLSIPRSLLRQAGITPEAPVLLEATKDGAILIRPAAVYPIERYTEERIAEFVAEDELDSDRAKRLRSALGK